MPYYTGNASARWGLPTAREEARDDADACDCCGLLHHYSHLETVGGDQWCEACRDAYRPCGGPIVGGYCTLCDKAGDEEHGCVQPVSKDACPDCGDPNCGTFSWRGRRIPNCRSDDVADQVRETADLQEREERRVER